MPAAAAIPTAGPEVRLGYEPGLDGLRALAAGLVVFHHLLLGGPTGGFIGVPIFFVLSGFLITSLIVRELSATGSLDVRRFWRRRMFRLYPALVVGAVLAVGLAVVTDTYRFETVLDALVSSVYLEDVKYWLFMHRGFSLFTNPWSLGVEAQYYAIWPVLVAAAVRRRPPGWLIAPCAVAIVVCLLLSALVQDHVGRSLLLGTSVGVTYDFPLFSAVPLLVGSTLGLALVAPGGVARLLRRPGVAAIAIVVLAIAFVFADANSALTLFAALPAVYLAAAAVIGSIVMGRTGLLARALSSAVLVWLGRRSYAVYLFHWPISVVARPLMASERVPLVLGTTLVLAELSWRLVETPFLRRGGGLRGLLTEPAVR